MDYLNLIVQISIALFVLLKDSIFLRIICIDILNVWHRIEKIQSQTEYT